MRPHLEASVFTHPWNMARRQVPGAGAWVPVQRQPGAAPGALAILGLGGAAAASRGVWPGTVGAGGWEPQVEVSTQGV